MCVTSYERRKNRNGSFHVVHFYSLLQVCKQKVSTVLAFQWILPFIQVPSLPSSSSTLLSIIGPLVTNMINQPLLWQESSHQLIDVSTLSLSSAYGRQSLTYSLLPSNLTDINAVVQEYFFNISSDSPSFNVRNELLIQRRVVDSRFHFSLLISSYCVGILLSQSSTIYVISF